MVRWLVVAGMMFAAASFAALWITVPRPHAHGAARPATVRAEIAVGFGPWMASPEKPARRSDRVPARTPGEQRREGLVSGAEAQGTSRVPFSLQPGHSPLWLWHRANPAGSRSDALSAILESLAEPVVGEIELADVESPPELSWWNAADADASCRAVLAFDLNQLRLLHADRFADQRINEALHELGLANARGVAIEVGDRVEMVVSYRSWARDRAERVALSTPGAAAAASAAGPAIQPNWSAWLETCLACHRALLDPLDRSPFDSRRGSWDRRNGQKLRQVLSALEGPIVMGEVGGEGYAMVRLGSRADEAMVMRLLAVVIEPVCDEIVFDPQTSGGRARIKAMVGAVCERVQWRVVQRERRRWLVVTRQDAAIDVAEALSVP